MFEQAEQIEYFLFAKPYQITTHSNITVQRGEKVKGQKGKKLLNPFTP